MCLKYNDEAMEEGWLIDRLEQSLGFTHGRLDVERPDVLPLEDVSFGLIWEMRDQLTCFLRREIKKLMDNMVFCMMWSSDMST